VRIFHVPPQAAFPGMARFSVSPANFYDWKRDARLFDGMALYRVRSFTLTGVGNAEIVRLGRAARDVAGGSRTLPGSYVYHRWR
jgi:hypothetical protein